MRITYAFASGYAFGCVRQAYAIPSHGLWATCHSGSWLCFAGRGPGRRGRGPTRKKVCERTHGADTGFGGNPLRSKRIQRLWADPSRGNEPTDWLRSCGAKRLGGANPASVAAATSAATGPRTGARVGRPSPPRTCRCGIHPRRAVLQAGKRRIMAGHSPASPQRKVVSGASFEKGAFGCRVNRSC